MLKRYTFTITALTLFFLTSNAFSDNENGTKWQLSYISEFNTTLGLRYKLNRITSGVNIEGSAFTFGESALYGGLDFSYDINHQYGIYLRYGIDSRYSSDKFEKDSRSNPQAPSRSQDGYFLQHIHFLGAEYRKQGFSVLSGIYYREDTIYHSQRVGLTAGIAYQI